MGHGGRYLYGIIKSTEPLELKDSGMPGGDPRIYTLRNRDLAICVSNFPVDQPVKADSEHCMAHVRALEAIAQKYTVLPFDFGTVAPSDNEALSLLQQHRHAIHFTLRKLHGKVEVAVKAFWKSLAAASQEVVKEHAVLVHYRDEIASKSAQSTYADRIRIGQMIASELNEKRKKEATYFMKVLRSVAVQAMPLAISGDTMVMNASFLVSSSDFQKFEQSLQQLDQRYDGRIDFKYTGPIPPYSFTGITLSI